MVLVYPAYSSGFKRQTINLKLNGSEYILYKNLKRYNLLKQELVLVVAVDVVPLHYDFGLILTWKQILPVTIRLPIMRNGECNAVDSSFSSIT